MTKSTLPTVGSLSTEEQIPFSKRLQPEELFQYPQMIELHRQLTLAIRERAMLLVSGEAGVGKTTAVHAFMAELPSNKYLVIYLGQDQEGSSLWKRMAYSLGLKASIARAQTRLTVSRHLSDNLLEKGKDVVLVIDEAHLLDGGTLEDIRLLTNADFDRTSPVSVVLIGQLPLRGRLKMPGFEALNQRLRYRCALEGYSEEETIAYVQHRLQAVGKPKDYFSTDATRQLFFAAQGIPRELNNLALAAILRAQADGLEKIDGRLMKKVIDQRDLS
jgi:type II secretory pathway predicted ATPase ExeA